MVPAPQNATWSPSGIVTLTTDFGLADPYVGIMKGVMHAVAAEQGAPRLELVDLTHAVPPQTVRVAAFHLEHAWRHFPRGTVHLAVVDPGVGSDRDSLVCVVEGHAFVAPDNGLLGPILAAAGDAAQCYRLDVERFRASELSRTFHGRDLYSPVAAGLGLGLDPAETGPAAERWEPLAWPRPRPGSAGELLCEVLLADGFGNLVTSARAEDLEGPPEAWICEMGAARFPLLGTYAEGTPGQLLALVDSFGYWEVAVRDGDAASRLAAAPGSPVVFRHKARE